MTRPDICALNTKVEAAIAAEERGEVTRSVLAAVPAAEPRNLYGLMVPQDQAHADAVKAKMAQRRRAIDGYRADADALQRKLREHGIDPLAIITTGAWNRIVELHRLFTLHPSPYGRVQINTEVIRELRGRIEPPPWLGAAIMLIGGASAGGLAAWNDLGAVGLAIGIGAALISATIFYLAYTIGRGRRFGRQVERWVAERSWEEILRALSFGGRLSGSDDGLGPHGPQIVLPPAPPHILDIARRIDESCFTLSIAADAGSIRFKESLTELFKTGLAQIVEQEREAARDPILYVWHGHAIAIVGYYGESPLELAAIDAVVNSEHLL